METRIKCKWLLLDSWTDEYEVDRKVLFERRFTTYYWTTMGKWQCLRNYSSTVWRSTRGRKDGQRRLFKIFVEMSSRASALLSCFKQDKLEFRVRHITILAATLMNNYRWHFILSIACKKKKNVCTFVEELSSFHKLSGYYNVCIFNMHILSFTS